ncbi:ROK family transcriptional regulator [Kitasatospora purpeofusca]|uniref:ROK family transcriptional regulator n=1 Tax=Kitasatospora purpeofusca TaxID=67352 RepID=UPI00225ADCC3|nr:ROK family transcriptional regulator [Kitasatospora purpeofusca]MCX4759147.1 ROK family transcriptional regulator [Kitasatospora purpeofusca]WSR30444.1 ROK family transcriptional regulator [Kitasatospora purpeofusca]WSR38683.1 ROK family transcriptional regulator [Kitasatospora purpeofusca]
MTTARTATPSTARAINDRLALNLLLDQGPLTATELRELTGLSRPTVADLLDRLGRSGLVAVVGERGEQRRGPNARVYALVASRAHLAAFDVRSGGVSLVVADLAGRTLATADLVVEDPGADDDAGHRAAAERIMSVLLDTARRAEIPHLHTVAVGAPGLVDPATGRLQSTGDLPAWHADLLAALRELPGTEVILENEVNLAGRAEYRTGAARGRDDFVLVWLGHSVGAAVVLDGRLRRGIGGGAGEICFLPVPGTAALPTATGCEGGFHGLVGSAAVCELARAHGLPADPADDAAAAEAAVRAALGELGDGRPGGPFLDELAERIALGTSAICVVLDPGCVVLGGEVGRAGGAELAARVERRLARLSPVRTEVRAGETGGGAILAGAVLTAGDAVRRDLFGEP